MAPGTAKPTRTTKALLALCYLVLVGTISHRTYPNGFHWLDAAELFSLSLAAVLVAALYNVPISVRSKASEDTGKTDDVKEEPARTILPDAQEQATVPDADAADGEAVRQCAGLLDRSIKLTGHLIAPHIAQWEMLKADVIAHCKGGRQALVDACAMPVQESEVAFVRWQGQPVRVGSIKGKVPYGLFGGSFTAHGEFAKVESIDWFISADPDDDDDDDDGDGDDANNKDETAKETPSKEGSDANREVDACDILVAGLPNLLIRGDGWVLLGYGLVVLADGTTIEGQWECGHAHGPVRCARPDGTIYVFDAIRGIPNGRIHYASSSVTGYRDAHLDTRIGGDDDGSRPMNNGDVVGVAHALNVVRNTSTSCDLMVNGRVGGVVEVHCANGDWCTWWQNTTATECFHNIGRLFIKADGDMFPEDTFIEGCQWTVVPGSCQAPRDMPVFYPLDTKSAQFDLMKRYILSGRATKGLTGSSSRYHMAFATAISDAERAASAPNAGVSSADSATATTESATDSAVAARAVTVASVPAAGAAAAETALVVDPASDGNARATVNLFPDLWPLCPTASTGADEKQGDSVGTAPAPTTGTLVTAQEMSHQ